MVLVEASNLRFEMKIDFWENYSWPPENFIEKVLEWIPKDMSRCTCTEELPKKHLLEHATPSIQRIF
jgi:hypothetical protein